MTGADKYAEYLNILTRADVKAEYLDFVSRIETKALKLMLAANDPVLKAKYVGMYDVALLFANKLHGEDVGETEREMFGG